jgi:4-amino-4-deoxy-L-arabinose transferase-like glycosyltransferase
LIIFGLAAVAGILIMYRATSTYGIGVTADSTLYLDVARNLLSGRGFTQSGGNPLTHYPPLYPAALALAGIFGSDVVVGAKWLHLLLYVASVLLVGVFVYRGTHGSLMAATLGLLFMLTSNSVLNHHVMVFSEALFVFFTLTGLLLLNEYLYRERLSILVAAFVVIGFAGLTRYVGFILIPIASLAVLILYKFNDFKKLIKITIISIICGAPIMLWIIRNRVMYSTSVNRSITYHTIHLKQMEDAVETISIWFFLPINLHLVWKLFILLTIASIALIILIKMIKRFGIHSYLNRVPLICSIFLCLYSGGLIFSVFFVEAHLPFNHRILLPFHVMLGVGLITLGRNAFHLSESPKWVAVLAVTLCAALLIARGQMVTRALNQFSENGAGFTGKEWRSSKAMEFVKALPADAPIYSNGGDAVGFLTGRQTMPLPGRRDSAGMEAMMRHLESSNGFLVYFNMIGWRGYLPSAEELKQLAELRPVYEGRDGIIFQATKLDK